MRVFDFNPTFLNRYTGIIYTFNSYHIVLFSLRTNNKLLYNIITYIIIPARAYNISRYIFVLVDY